MASKRIDVVINGQDKTSSAFKGAAQNIEKLGVSASATGGKIGTSVSKGAEQGTKALDKMGSSGVKSMGNITNAATDLGSVLGGLIGSYGLMEMAQSAWTGATQKQFNAAYLGTKMSKEAAKEYLKVINEVVAQVPGDDTYMNQLLSGAVAKQTNLSTAEIKALGVASADYLSTSQAMGKSAIETQMDLKEYILTGNTAQMERDSILKSQIGTLKNQGTVSERILALNKALTAEGYAGLSQLDIASIKLEELKGKFQLALTNIGSVLLTAIEPVLDAFLTLDEATNGLSTTFMVVAGAVGLVGIAAAGLASVAIPAITGLAVSLGVVAEGATFAAAGMGLLEVAMGPVGWAILGITAAVAAGIWVWSEYGDQISSTIDKFKAGDWAGVATDISSSLSYVGQIIWDTISNLPAMIGNALSNGISFAETLLNWMITGLDSLSTWLDSILKSMENPAESGGQAIGGGLIDGMFNWLNSNGPRIVNLMVQVVLRLIPLIGEVGLKIGQILVGKAMEGISWGAGQIWNAITSPFRQAYNTIHGIWESLKAYIGGGIRTVVSVSFGSLNAAWSAANRLLDTLRTITSRAWNAITNVFGGGARGPSVSGVAGARGPSLHYENYAGHKKNAWNASGTGLSGNCVDMTLGLMSAYGGSMVQGTWNGGPHVWWQSPSGAQIDPARKALEGTYNPPARGPGSGFSGTTIIVQGNILDGDDFRQMVEKANGKTLYSARAF